MTSWQAPQISAGQVKAGAMSPVADETADDLPVRDVGLMRGGLMPTVPGLCVDILRVLWVESKTVKEHDAYGFCNSKSSDWPFF